MEDSLTVRSKKRKMESASSGDVEMKVKGSIKIKMYDGKVMEFIGVRHAQEINIYSFFKGMVGRKNL